jgi:nucleotide-binding universal stress UspA family protein
MDRAIMICVGGLEIEEFLRTALGRVQWREGGDPVLLVYVVDSRPPHEVREARLRFFGRQGQDDERMAEAETSTAQQVLAEATAICARLGVPAARLGGLTLHGRPEQEIIRTANEQRASLIVVGARYRGAGRPLIGPQSVGHVARFVLDHAPCDVLLLR